MEMKKIISQIMKMETMIMGLIYIMQMKKKNNKKIMKLINLKFI
jgi:hypothetical protein